MHVTQSKFSKAIQKHFKTEGGEVLDPPSIIFDYIVTFFKNVCGLDHLI